MEKYLVVLMLPLTGPLMVTTMELHLVVSKDICYREMSKTSMKEKLMDLRNRWIRLSKHFLPFPSSLFLVFVFGICCCFLVGCCYFLSRLHLFYCPFFCHLHCCCSSCCWCTIGVHSVGLHCLRRTKERSCTCYS